MFLKEERSTVHHTIVENLLHDSSNLLKSSYNYGTNRLVITFKTKKVYQYFDVPHKIYEEFKTAPSSGKYFNAEIKKYKFLLMGEAQQEIVDGLLTEITDLKNNNQ